MPYQDRKSTRLNSSHGSISYAVFCLKKKKKELLRQDGAVLDIDLYLSAFRPENATQLTIERRECKLKAFSSEMKVCFIFFFNDTATTEIYTLSLHDALPI